MKTLDGGDRIDEISVTNSAHNVGIERGQTDILSLPFPLLPLVDLCLDGAGGPLDGSRHLHPVLVLQRRRSRRTRLLLHCLRLALESKAKIDEMRSSLVRMRSSIKRMRSSLFADEIQPSADEI